MEIDLTPNELKDPKRLERILISKSTLFKKIALMHGRGDLPKIKVTLCNVPIEFRPADSNALIMVKLKQNLSYRGYVYFETVYPCAIYQALDYLKQYKFYEDITISEGLLSYEMLTFSETVPAEENLGTAPVKISQNELPFTSVRIL